MSMIYGPSGQLQIDPKGGKVLKNGWTYYPATKQRYRSWLRIENNTPVWLIDRLTMHGSGRPTVTAWSIQINGFMTSITNEEAYLWRTKYDLMKMSHLL